MTRGVGAQHGLLGTLCVVAALSGCAAPAGFNRVSGIWSRWADSVENHEFSQAERELKNPVKLNLAYARFREDQGDIAEARKRYEIVLDEQPKLLEATLGLARLDHLAGRTSEAKRRFQQALDQHPGRPQALDAMGQFYVCQKRWDEAVQLLRSAMNADPQEPTYRYHLAIALARSGDIESAMTHFVETVGEAQAHYNVGFILYQQGRLDAAEWQFAQAVRKKPDLQQAQEMLVTVRRKTGHTPELTGAESRQPPEGGRMASTGRWPAFPERGQSLQGTRRRNPNMPHTTLNSAPARNWPATGLPTQPGRFAPTSADRSQTDPAFSRIQNKPPVRWSAESQFARRRPEPGEGDQLGSRVQANPPVTQPDANAGAFPHWSAPQKPNVSAGYRVPSHHTRGDRVVNPTYFQPGPVSSQPSRRENNPSSAAPSRPAPPAYADQVPRWRAPSSHQTAEPSAPETGPNVPAGMTPQQFEQWQNQIGVETGY